MKLTELLGHEASALVQLGKKRFWIRYDPMATTVSFRMGLATLDFSDVAVLLADVLIGWELTDDQGNELPISADSILQLPVSVMQAIIVSLAEASLSPEGN